MRSRRLTKFVKGGGGAGIGDDLIGTDTDSNLAIVLPCEREAVVKQK